MTKAQFEKAEELKQRIANLDKLIEKLSVYDYKLAPPTRQTSWEIRCNVGTNPTRLDLNEGEVITILEAFKSQKSVLEREFDRL